MSVPSYTAARSIIKAAIAGEVSGWDIFDTPREKMTTRTIALAPRGARLVAANRWLREIIAAVFVPAVNLEEAVTALESVTIDIHTAMRGPGARVVETESPVAVTVAGDDYLAQFHLIEIETST